MNVDPVIYVIGLLGGTHAPARAIEGDQIVNADTFLAQVFRHILRCVSAVTMPVQVDFLTRVLLERLTNVIFRLFAFVPAVDVGVINTKRFGRFHTASAECLIAKAREEHVNKPICIHEQRG